MSHPNRKSILLGELDQYPQGWVLTPTDGNKRPYRKGWQNETPLSREAIAEDIRLGRAQGVGIRSGQISGGILCIDFDGLSALPKYLELSGGIEPPLTVGWTSGKQGRWQLAFVVPIEKWDAIATKKIPTAWDSNGKATEFLEFRWDGCQSVLPGSVHPQTGSYYWLPGQSPAECEIALAPEYILNAAKPEPKFHQSSERVATDQTERVTTDPIDDPWDIRNFATYLDGHLPDGRRGWSTCKCPAHNGTSDDSLHINQTTGQFKCHAGCSTKDVYYAAVELAKSRGYQFPEKRTGKGFFNLDSWLFNLKKRLAKTISRRNFWGVAGEDELESVTTNNQPALEYQPGERLDAWAKATQEKHKFILDSSATGLGKSFDTGMATPELFEVSQLIYLSSEHRNPTVPTLQSWPDLEARHEGLGRDEFGKLRRVQPDHPYLIPPNCGRYGTISALRSKNIPGADTAEEICLSCKFLEPCRAGSSYDYLFQRCKTLSQPRFRAHPVSLPDPIDYNYSETILFWDEASEILKKHLTIEVSEQDLNLAIARLALKLPQTWDALRPLLNTLHEFLSGQQKQPNKFGWNDTQIRDLLPKLNGIDVAAIADALKPDLRFLNTTAEYGVNLSELPRQVRKNFSDSDTATAERVMREVGLNWLPDFLRVLLGNVEGGSLRIQYEKLIITLPDQRLVNIALAAKLNVFLDATAATEDLARVLGIDCSEILVVRQGIPDTNNLDLIQLATMGRLGIGSRRRNEKGEDTFLQKRINALIDQIKEAEAQGKKVAVIDFKRFTSDGDGKRRWWTDSRGLNDFEDVDVLILIGVPCRNLADLEAEFTVLYGRVPKEGTERVRYQIEVKGKGTAELHPYFEMEVSADPDFREFCRRRILADIHQAIGRLRAHRRPGQQLKVYFIGDYPLDIPVTLRKASDITPEAATKVERIEMAIRGAIQQLKATGQKITQSAIAAITGYSQQYISRFRGLLQMLLEPINSKSSKNGDPPPDPDEAQWISKEYLPLLADSPPRELLEGILTTFEAYGASVFQSIWDATPAVAQVKILEALMFTLSEGELRSLFAAVATT